MNKGICLSKFLAIGTISHPVRAGLQSEADLNWGGQSFNLGGSVEFSLVSWNETFIWHEQRNFYFYYLRIIRKSWDLTEAFIQSGKEIVHQMDLKVQWEQRKVLLANGTLLVP